jgi:hypothetical protein
MKALIALACAALVLGACRSDDGPAPRPNDQDGMERVCSTEDFGEGPVEICFCKTATDMTQCPAA